MPQVLQYPVRNILEWNLGTVVYAMANGMCSPSPGEGRNVIGRVVRIDRRDAVIDVEYQEGAFYSYRAAKSHNTIKSAHKRIKRKTAWDRILDVPEDDE